MSNLDTSFRELDQLCDAFERSLKAGESPRLEEYLVKTPADMRRAALAELLTLEVELRRVAGQTPTPAEYEARFPGNAETVHRVFRQSTKDTAEIVQDIPRPRGQRVGPYKLLQMIGAGGMGEVWMAEQEEPVRRRVALKIIKAGHNDQQILARFEAERQALAMMDHQNIAKVLDAGTSDDGVPYFVMELVQGDPITKYCDTHKLTPHERLELFVQACDAVQHAHYKGIIHRDLKPSNMLVQIYDGKAIVKVIDFGLAKAVQHHIKLTDKTVFTEFGRTGDS